MSAPRYTFGATVEHGILELEVTFGFDVAWGSPETGRFGPPEDYDPGAGDVVEGLVILEVEGNAWPCGVGEYSADELGPALLTAARASEDEMLAEAGQQEAGERDRGAEYAAEARKEDARLERWPWLRDDDF